MPVFEERVSRTWSALRSYLDNTSIVHYGNENEQQTSGFVRLDN